MVVEDSGDFWLLLMMVRRAMVVIIIMGMAVGSGCWVVLWVMVIAGAVGC